MSTITLPQSPPPAPEPTYATTGPARVVVIRADLLPEELIASRRLIGLKRNVALALVALLVLLVAWYAFSVWSTSKAKHDLGGIEQKAAQLQHQQAAYTPLVTAQSESAQISTALQKVMAGDLQWKNMLGVLRNSATHGITVDSIDATMTSGAAGAGAAAGNAGLGVLNQSGKQQVGTLTITGTAPDKNTVAAYVDTLAKVTGLAAPFPASLTDAGGSFSFSVSVIITSDALGGRYAPPAANTGGK
jgi:Tfp pilus assembly protein PilN